MVDSLSDRHAGRRVLAVEIAGVIFIILLGSTLHFTYELWSNPVVGSFSAVNESVWEHMKIVFWPALLWMLITIVLLRSKVNNFFAAKTAGAYFMVAFIPAVFYTYTAFTGESILVVDIGSFVVAVILGQALSYMLFRVRQLSKLAEGIAIIAIVALAAVFVVFTFYPPHLPIFNDPSTDNYGI